MSKDTSVVTTPRLKLQFQQSLAKELQKNLGLENLNQVPKLEKIVINVGLGAAKTINACLRLCEPHYVK